MYPVPVTHALTSDKIEVAQCTRVSTGAEISPIELATKCRDKSKKGVSVCPIILHKVALGVVLHVVSYSVAVSAHASIHAWLAAALGVAAAHAVHDFWLGTTCDSDCILTMTCTTMGMLLQFGCFIQDTAAAIMAAPPKLPRGQVQRTSRPPYCLFSFPKGKLNKIFSSVWVVLDNPNKCCMRAFCQQSSSFILPTSGK